jgi:hypothetical protein
VFAPVGALHNRAVPANFNIRRLDALMNPGTARTGQSLQIRVEGTPIDNYCLGLLCLEANYLPFGRMKANSAQFIQGNICGNREFPENLRSNNACAVYGLACVRVFLKNVNLETITRQASGGMQADRSTSDNDYIVQRTLQNSCSR